LGSITIVCDSKENVGVELKKEYDKFKTDYVALIDGIEIYPHSPVEYFIDHVKVTGCN